MKQLPLWIMIVSAMLLANVSVAQDFGLADHPFADMMTLKDSRTMRLSSWDRSGRNNDFISVAPGKTVTLGEIEGAGCIRRFYCAVMQMDRMSLRDLVLRVWWDGEEHPSIEVPLGDFFGVVPDAVRRHQSLMVNVNPGSDRAEVDGMVLWFPMPFSDGARITLEHQGDAMVPALWYQIDYEQLEGIGEETGRFHAQWRREMPTTVDHVDESQRNVHLWNGQNQTGEENYVILDAKGWGNYVGAFLHINNVNSGWYGEGDEMIFIDGEEWPPRLHGTGTEEIYNAGAIPDEEFAGPYTGFYRVENEDFSGNVSAYRFYVNDPVRFRKSVRVTVEHGHANNYANDYCSTAFWYQSEPHEPFPPLPPAAERRPVMPEKLGEALAMERRVMMPFIMTFGVDFQAQGSEQGTAALAARKALTLAYRDFDYDRALVVLGEMEGLTHAARKR